jgi:hypothetical protein
MDDAIRQAPVVGPVFSKETLINGAPARIDCVDVGGQLLSLSRRPLKVVSLEDEWYEDLGDPVAAVESLKRDRELKPDLLTFWQRLPDTEPRYPFQYEWEEVAALPVSTYEHWWKKQINAKSRNMIRKSERMGLVVRETTYDDSFVRGMTAIFNESPTRQGRRFWHYGKDFETVKHQFSRFVSREIMVGAYYGDEMVGFMMLGDAGRYCLTGQVISSLHHREKAANNAMIAKAVQLCAQRNFPFLVYYSWTHDSLSEFKRHCGFEPVRVPRYWVPLTWKGRLALACGLHRSWKALIPAGVKSRLKDLRRRWCEQGAA